VSPLKRKPQLRKASSQHRNILRRALAMRVLKNLRRALRLAKSRSGTLQRGGPVTNAEMWVLRELGKHPGLKVTDLARATALHQSSISNVMRKMKQKQLVRDKRDDVDARVVRLYLTAAGERMVSANPSVPHNHLLSTLERLSAKTLNQLDRELTDLLHRTHP
jgi:DNA-binding MarR family transcriptional regulator